jgi:hypothetical protein
VLGHLLLAVAVSFGINLMPAFGPPTWAVLVFFMFRYCEVPAGALIRGGAIAAVSGRALARRAPLWRKAAAPAPREPAASGTRSR